MQQRTILITLLKNLFTWTVFLLLNDSAVA